MTRGGPRPGAGRPPSPRLPPAEAGAMLSTLAAGRSDAALARALGVTPQAVCYVRKRGMTEAQAKAWTARLPRSVEP